VELNQLLDKCVKEKASDLHISPDMPPLLRVDGDLVPIEGVAPLSAQDTKALVYSAMSIDQQQIFEKNWEFDFATKVSNAARFRVNAFYQMTGVAAAFRAIPDEIPTLDQLGLPIMVKDLLDSPNGLILVTGPTGSGKSTTLAAMIGYINANKASHIITIEDPIEFTHKSKKCLINQRQVHRDTHDFSAALRAALREDPNVIMVGEMRDLETIRLALTAAETGHLVLATLHTSSAPRTINRVVDVFPVGEKNMIRNMLSESLRAVICQTLVKRHDGGRVAALELMLGTPAIRNLIREDRVAQMVTAIQTGAELGMCSLDQYLQRLVNKQIIPVEIARAAVVDKESFPA